MFALVDCNNFFASCERLFRPDLRDKPVIVLSSGDGCAIARSNEAKALGIKMGDPYFKIKELCHKKHIHVFSSNFTLYRDMSQRVMSVIKDAWMDVEIYSIDEAFLDLSSLPLQRHESFCYDLQKYILKCTGIPTSIGLGKSKTLAKISNHIAKRELRTPVFNVSQSLEWLKKVNVADVWGIGRQWSQQLIKQHIHTAHDLAIADIHQLKKKYNIVMMRIAMELKGESCIDLTNDATPKKSILSSRSFCKAQTEFNVIAQAVSTHCASAYEKLRAQGSLTQVIHVFLKTNRFRDDLPQYNSSAFVQLVNPTDDIRVITHHAKKCLQEIYKPGFQYKKAGVWLDNLTDHNMTQFDLFYQSSEQELNKTSEFLSVFDEVNHRFGKDTLRLAAEGFEKSWDTQLKLKSPAYTTRWADLPVIKNET